MQLTEQRSTAENDATPNSGSLKITDDDGMASDLTITIGQIAKPV